MDENLQSAVAVRQVPSTISGRSDRLRTLQSVLAGRLSHRKVVTRVGLKLLGHASGVQYRMDCSLVPRACDSAGYEAGNDGGTWKLILVNPRSMTVTGGSGADTVSADSGSNRYVAGSGLLDVTGGPGADDFVLHAGAGQLTIEDFDAGKGDRLLLDKSLQGPLKQASDGHGGTLLSVGTEGSTIDLINHGTLSQSSIQFI